jgi:hypothetical protein
MNSLRKLVARWNDGCRRLASTQGQGTVEYVGIVLVVGALLFALKGGFTHTSTAAISSKLVSAVSQAIASVAGTDSH